MKVVSRQFVRSGEGRYADWLFKSRNKDGGVELCNYSLRYFFDIPREVKRITISLHTRPGAARVPVVVLLGEQPDELDIQPYDEENDRISWASQHTVRIWDGPVFRALAKYRHDPDVLPITSTPKDVRFLYAEVEYDLPR